MKIVGKFTNYIIVHEISDFGKICFRVLDEKAKEKLLLSLRIQISELVDLSSESISFKQDDIDCLFREYYWGQDYENATQSHGVILNKDFIIFKKDASCEKRGVYQVKLMRSRGLPPKAILLEKLDSLTLEEFVKASESIFLDKHTFSYRLKEYQNLLSKFEKGYYDMDVGGAAFKEPQSLFNQVSSFILKHSGLFGDISSKVSPDITDRTSILKVKMLLSKHINEFSLQSMGIAANNTGQMTNMYVMLSELIGNGFFSSPILFLEECKEEKNSKSRYFSVCMIQEENGIVCVNTVGTLKIRNVDDCCVLYDKDSLIEYSEPKSLELLEEYLKSVKNLAIELLPGTKVPLEETYRLGIGCDEKIFSDDAKSSLQF